MPFPQPGRFSLLRKLRVRFSRAGDGGPQWRTPLSDGDVLRPRGLDAAFRAARSRGFARAHPPLPRGRGRGGPELLRFHRAVSRRWDARVLRLSAGARGLRGAGRARRAGNRAGGRGLERTARARGPAGGAGADRGAYRAGGGEPGRGERRETSVIVGLAANLAARLQTLAQPGTVVISGATHRLLRGAFAACRSANWRSRASPRRPPFSR